METEDDRRKRQRRNQRRISEQEKRLRKVVGDLPPPPQAGSSQQEDKAYSAIRAFEVEQMTYAFSFCEVCKERRLECKGTRNMCTRCRRDKKVPKVWSGENNMDPMAVPEILSDMSDAEQMLIARLAPTVHVHLLKHGGIASKGHCIAFPQAVQEPATILPVIGRDSCSSVNGRCQLPPVCDTPVYISDSRSALSTHGRLVSTMFDSAVEFTQIIRQGESEQQLRDVLVSLTNYTPTLQQIHWLQQFQWHNVRMSHGPELLARMGEQGLCAPS